MSGGESGSAAPLDFLRLDSHLTIGPGISNLAGLEI